MSSITLQQLKHYNELNLVELSTGRLISPQRISTSDCRSTISTILHRQLLMKCERESLYVVCVCRLASNRFNVRMVTLSRHHMWT
jgi:hypothetical protein